MSDPNTSPDTFSKTHGKQLYISFMVYMFDVLSYISVSFVVPYMAKEIYPSVNIGISLLVTWGGFAAGAVFRPFGAAIFSKMVDVTSRKKSISINLTLSSVLTAAIALVPTYSQVGVFSPIIFIVLRLAGGVFIGALISGGLALGPENFPEKLRGFLTGVTESGAHWAHAVGAAWFLLTTLIVVGSMYTSYGWRFMFLLFLIPLAAVLPILHYTPESSIQVMAKRTNNTEKSPLRSLLSKKGNIRNAFILAVFMAIGLNGYTSNTDNVFPTFLKEVNHMLPSSLATIVLIGGFLGVIGAMLGGALSQKIGRRNLAIIVGFLILVSSYLFIPLGNTSGKSFYTILILTAPMYFFPTMLLADFAVILNETFRTANRGTAIGVAWNLGYATAAVWPLVISAIIAIRGIGVYASAQFVLVAVLAALFIVATFLSKESKGNISVERQEMIEEEKTL
jgi:MFS family permease